MSNNDVNLLAKISHSCFFRLQPQPLVDLLNQRGIIGRPAEVFWTYFHWGFQNRSFSCQLSSSYLAEALFTDIRTIQRANERLMEAGLITRVRAKRTTCTHLEAPAITTIAIPDDEVRALLESAPVRSNTLQEDSRTPSKAINPEETRSEFTDVNKSNPSAYKSRELAPLPSPTDEKPSKASPGSRGGDDLARIKAALPAELQQLHDMCLVKAEPGPFKKALKELAIVSDADAETLIQPLVKALDCKRRELSAVQTRTSANEHSDKPGGKKTKTRIHTRPDDPRRIPKKVISFIEERLRSRADYSRRDELGTVLREMVYSITVGTMRGLDLMHAVNTAVKLVRTRQWSRPLGMPEGWKFDQVLQGAS